MCNMANTHVRHDSFTYATWPIHTSYSAPSISMRKTTSSFGRTTALINSSTSILSTSYLTPRDSSWHVIFPSQNPSLRQQSCQYTKTSHVTHINQLQRIHTKHTVLNSPGFCMTRHIPVTKPLAATGHTYKCVRWLIWVASHIWPRHVTDMNEACRKHESCHTMTYSSATHTATHCNILQHTATHCNTHDVTRWLIRTHDTSHSCHKTPRCVRNHVTYT